MKTTISTGTVSASDDKTAKQYFSICPQSHLENAERMASERLVSVPEMQNRFPIA